MNADEQKMWEYVHARWTDMKPMTLAAFRERIETGDYDKHEWGGCGCGV